MKATPRIMWETFLKYLVTLHCLFLFKSKVLKLTGNSVLGEITWLQFSRGTSWSNVNVCRFFSLQTFSREECSGLIQWGVKSSL